MSKITDKVMGHAAENDGIEEFDNPLPDWWIGLFILCVIWGIGYAIDFHFVSQHSQVQFYEAEMAAAAEMWPQSDQAAEVKVDAASIAAGQEIFTANCVACHAADMTGGIGPNLVDDEWIHGGDLETIRRIIDEGVPAKGMLTWGPILGPEKVNQVAAYVYSKSHPE